MLAREAGHTDFMCDAWSHAQVLSRKAVASTQTARHDQVMQHNGFKEKAHSSPANVVMYVLTLKVLLAKTLCIQAGVHTKHAHLFPCKNSIVVSLCRILQLGAWQATWRPSRIDMLSYHARTKSQQRASKDVYG
eukprot:939798-Pelagomonas_calceolata.AAC.2